MKHRSAFSIVELSVVLAIIGLLIGSIVAGQSMIRSSRVKGVSSDIYRYTEAIKNFHDRFKAFPGDMLNATLQWGAVTGNGNGDNIISGGGEDSRAWQHLALAGLIQGSYSGAYTNPIVFGTNAPTSSIANAGFDVATTAGGAFGDGGPYPKGMIWSTLREGKVVLFFGGASDTARGGTAISPSETQDLDTKMDDGAPDYGTLESIVGNGCTTGSTSPAAYALSTPNKLVCSFSYIVVPQ